MVGDSHHPAQDTEPFAQECVDTLILEQLKRTLCIDNYQVEQRWIGKYPVGRSDTDALILAPDTHTRVVSVISGTGASTAFGLAEEVMHQWGI